MPAYPSCDKCSVCKSVRLVIDSYRFFQGAIKDSVAIRITDHARGFRHGQLAVLDEVIGDLTDLIPHIHVEREFKMNGKGD